MDTDGHGWTRMDVVDLMDVVDVMDVMDVVDTMDTMDTDETSVRSPPMHRTSIDAVFPSVVG